MSKPLFILATLGLPGAGKTHFSRKFASEHNFFHLNSDHLRHEMFEYPQYTEEESIMVFTEMERIANEKLKHGQSIIFDANAILKTYRNDLQKMARKYDAKYCLMWFKSDVEKALAGIKKRKEIKEQELKKHHITLDEDVAKWLVSNVGRKIEKPRACLKISNPALRGAVLSCDSSLQSQNSGDYSSISSSHLASKTSPLGSSADFQTCSCEPYVELDASESYDELNKIVESALGMNKIKAIIFDWHGVIDGTRLRNVIKEWSDYIKISEKKVRNTLADIMHPWMTGAMESDDFWNQVCHRLGVTKEQFSLFSKKSLKIDMNEELWDYLPKLKKRYKLAILSNIGTNKMSLIKNTIDLSIFDEVRFSAEVGKDKSEDEFFLELSRALGFLPCEILFVDDTLRHIEKAKNLGFGTYLFGDLIGLKKVIDEN